MQTKLEVSRGPRGLQVHLPSGRTLDIRADEAGVRFLERMLRDADENAHYERTRSGYIGDFPTQHIIDIWEREDKNRAAINEQVKEIKARKKREAREATERKWADQGVDLGSMEFKL